MFFIGATLGNALSCFIPLPLSLLAGMGFLAVFAGAANTPLACAVMGIELFGAPLAMPLAAACGISYVLSGHGGIYLSQRVDTPKAAGLTLGEELPLRAARHGALRIRRNRLHQLFRLREAPPVPPPGKE